MVIKVRISRKHYALRLTDDQSILSEVVNNWRYSFYKGAN